MAIVQLMEPYTLYEQYAGSFCIVYPLKHVRKSIPDKCLRVWYNIVDINLVKTVSNYFKSRRCPYVMNYEYYDEALRLDSGEKIPGVVMDWVHGKTLHSYVKDNRNNSAAITKVASQFLEMAKSMKSLGISHGDLSGDNIMVRNDGTLMLIDYDSFLFREWQVMFCKPLWAQQAISIRVGRQVDI